MSLVWLPSATCEADICENSNPLYVGSYSGCSKKITEIENQEIPSYLLQTIYLSSAASLIIVYILPIIVFLPMGGGSGTTGGGKYPNHYAQGQKEVGASTNSKRLRNKAFNNDGDESSRVKQPRRGGGGRPNTYPDHVCGDCSIWRQSGSHLSLHVHHQCKRMRHPGPQFQALSDYAPHGGITIALNPDSCVCQGCFLDFYNRPVKPMWYRKYEELLFNENCEGLNIGAEVEIETYSENASVNVPSHNKGDTSLVVDNGTSNTEVKEQTKLVREYALAKLVEEGCVYTRDLVSMLKNNKPSSLKYFYKQLSQEMKCKGNSKNRRFGQVIYDHLRFSEAAITYVYNLHVSKWQLEQTVCNEEKLSELIKNNV